MNSGGNKGKPNKPVRNGLTVEELKQMTAVRMAQVQTGNGIANNNTNKDIEKTRISHNNIPLPKNNIPVPHQVREPYTPSNVAYAPVPDKTAKLSSMHYSSPTTQAMEPVMPHGLTVQELKQLTRMRLARESSREFSNLTELDRVETTRHGPSYNYSGASSPLSNPDSDSVEDTHGPYSQGHYGIGISPDVGQGYRGGLSHMPVGVGHAGLDQRGYSTFSGHLKDGHAHGHGYPQTISPITTISTMSTSSSGSTVGVANRHSFYPSPSSGQANSHSIDLSYMSAANGNHMSGEPPSSRYQHQHHGINNSIINNNSNSSTFVDPHITPPRQFSPGISSYSGGTSRNHVRDASQSHSSTSLASGATTLGSIKKHPSGYPVRPPISSNATWSPSSLYPSNERGREEDTHAYTHASTQPASHRHEKYDTSQLSHHDYNNMSNAFPGPLHDNQRYRGPSNEVCTRPLPTDGSFQTQPPPDAIDANIPLVVDRTGQNLGHRTFSENQETDSIRTQPKPLTLITPNQSNSPGRNAALAISGLFPAVSSSGSSPSSPSSPGHKTLLGRKQLSLACPAPVRRRSLSDTNNLAFEVAESVLNSPGMTFRPKSLKDRRDSVKSNNSDRRDSLRSWGSRDDNLAAVAEDDSGLQPCIDGYRDSFCIQSESIMWNPSPFGITNANAISAAESLSQLGDLRIADQDQELSRLDALVSDNRFL